MSDLSHCLLYGATGYTGTLMAELAAAAGERPILAARSEGKLKPLAERLGLPWRAVGLDDPDALDAALHGIDVVLHAAGPFARTSAPMVAACLRTKTHYLDITGEIPVFEACFAQDGAAKAAGITVLPGVGFDVVPSDCLAAHTAARMPGAKSLVLAFKTVGGRISHGTATTMVTGLGEPSARRIGGRIRAVRMGSRSRKIDFGRGPKPALGIPWGDVSTAFHSTGIPDVEVFLSATGGMIAGACVGGFLGPLLKTEFVRNLAQKRIDAADAGPGAEQRGKAFSILVAEVSDGERTLTSRLRCSEGYDLTARSGLEVARRAARGELPTGFQTPSRALGADFVLELEGGNWEDLD